MAITLSPLNRRHLGAFRANRYGCLTLRLFLTLFAAYLPAELVTSDHPLLLEYHGRWFLSVLQGYPETIFSSGLSFPPDYHSRLMSERIVRNGRTLWPPIHFDARGINYVRPASAPPSAGNWLGISDQGHDILARMVYSSCLSILFALSLTSAPSLLEICTGAVQGYYGGRIDLFDRYFIEVWPDLPMLYLPIILASLVQPGVGQLLTIMLLFFWTSPVDVVRVEFLCGRHLEHVRVAWAFGLGDVGMMFQHILSNIMVTTLIFLPFLLCNAVITLTVLDFLSFGLPPSPPSPGELAGQSHDNLQALQLGLTVFVILTALFDLPVLIGGAVRSTLNPGK